MSELRRVYRVATKDESNTEINRILAEISDRLDQMEGFRDNPHFRDEVNFGGHGGTNLAASAEDSDIVRRDELTSGTVVNEAPIYERLFGDGVKDGSWRIRITGDDFQFQVLKLGVWTDTTFWRYADYP